MASKIPILIGKAIKNKCIEGPSAVGKTTTCKELTKHFDVFTIPEVIRKPVPNLNRYQQAIYYLNKEVQRWELAQEKLKIHELVVLDSDPFKPLWFNWSFNYEDCLALDELELFYRKNLEHQSIGFADGYVLLTTTEQDLRIRKANDPTRERLEFDHLMRINKPRETYYLQINNWFQGYVNKFNAISIEQNVININNAVRKFSQPSDHPFSLQLFNLILNFESTTL